MSSYLEYIGTAVPDFALNQMTIHAFMQQVLQKEGDDAKKLRLLYERSGIETRHSVIPDYGLGNIPRELFPPTDNLEPFPNLETRMQLFHQHATSLGAQAVFNAIPHFEKMKQTVSHLITVSCTGMSAPGLDIALIESLGLQTHIQRTSVNFMGCYAAVHAFKMAHDICIANAHAKVLIVDVELCTIHFQKSDDADNLTANALFADGAAACLISGEAGALNKKNRLVGFYSEVHLDGKKDMAWQLSSHGFLMTLSAYIPQLIDANIETLIAHACKHYELKNLEDIGIWAIHPGGRKILDVISARLQLPTTVLRHSYEVLKNYGNMSSATIFFVLKRIIEDDSLSGNLFGVAFGPGLTMETFLMDKR